MYQTRINEQPATLDFSGPTPLLNGAPFDWNVVKLSERTYHLLHQNRSFTAEVLAIDPVSKTVSLKLNGHVHEVQLKDRFDLLLEKMGMSSAAGAKVNDVKAPMPGLIVGVSVQPGDAVKKGDSVLILEAMKMENVIKAPGDGTVRSVRVTKGDRVEKGQVLIEF